MLESTLPLADQLLSGADGQSYTAIETPRPISGAQPRPYEPSTLVLAFVGMATVAIYLAAGGLRKSRVRRASAPARSVPEQRRAA